MSEGRGSQRIGSTLRGKYRLDRLLGEGGMAVVYAATHRNKKRFAIKMLHPELSNEHGLRERFLREGYVSNSVGHPGAVAVLDDDVAEDGSAFIVMELLDGRTVEEAAAAMGGRLPLACVLAIGHQVADILAAAHSKGVVHRDIKPANLFLTPDGTVKVLDFGIARLREATAGSGPTATSTGVMMGTPAFMPPEQATGLTRDIDGRTDLWALGSTLFNLLSGEFVHTGETSNQLLIAAATSPARALSSVVRDVPEPVVALVACALAFDKSARFATADHMREAIGKTYAALYGEEISAAVLAGQAMGGKTVLLPPVAPRPARVHADAPVHTVAMSAPLSAGKVQLPGALTTSKPVVAAQASTSHWAHPAPRSRSGLLLAVGSIALAAVVIVAVAATVLLRDDSPRGIAAVPQAPAVVDAAPAPPAATLSVAASAKLVASAVTATTEPPSLDVSALPTAGAHALAVGGPARPTTPAIPPVAPLPATTATAAPTKASCEPPYTVGPGGKRVYKPACL